MSDNTANKVRKYINIQINVSHCIYALCTKVTLHVHTTLGPNDSLGFDHHVFVRCIAKHCVEKRDLNSWQHVNVTVDFYTHFRGYCTVLYYTASHCQVIDKSKCSLYSSMTSIACCMTALYPVPLGLGVDGWVSFKTSRTVLL